MNSDSPPSSEPLDVQLTTALLEMRAALSEITSSVYLRPGEVDRAAAAIDKASEALASYAAAQRQPDDSEAAQVCYQAYQVIGSMLEDLGQFNTDRATKILDNLSQARMVHEDVLPWPSFHPPADQLPPLGLRIKRLAQAARHGFLEGLTPRPVWRAIVWTVQRIHGRRQPTELEVTRGVYRNLQSCANELLERLHVVTEERDALKHAAEQVMDMALCESLSVVLREGQLYRFWKTVDCEKCASMSAASSESYGPPPQRSQHE